MIAVNWTRLLVILLTILVALVLTSFLLWVTFHVIADLLLLFVAAILAYLLSPLVARVQRVSGLPRPLTIVLLYLAFGILLIGVGSLFAPATVEQARVLQARWPSLTRQLSARVMQWQHTLHVGGVTFPTQDVARNVAGAVGGAGPTILGGALHIASSVGTVVLDSVLVLVMAFYLLNDQDTIAHRASGILPQPYASSAAFIVRSAGSIVGRYVRAQLAVAAMVGLLGGGGAAVLGVQYAPLIGVFAFLAESIPVLGPIIATLPAVAIALLDSPYKAVAVLVWFIVIQQLEQNVIMPRLSGHAVGIHPVAAIMAVLIGFSLGSVWGALLGVPLMGFGLALLREAWRLYGPTATDPSMPTATVTPSMPEATEGAGRPSV